MFVKSVQNFSYIYAGMFFCEYIPLISYFQEDIQFEYLE